MKYNYMTSVTGIYNILKKLAKENRKEPTPAEDVLWKYLRGKSLGFRFRRQHPVNDFIVDFICLQKKLIVEVDGGYHNETEVMISDREREIILKQQGFEVIRFTNEEVLYNIENVIDKIKSKMKEQDTKRTNPPSFGGVRGRCIIVSAPSGSGKSTIVQYLMQEHPEFRLKFSVSATSRPPRGKEQHGVEYFFLSPEEFREKIENDEFLEYEEVYHDRFYGTLKSQVERQLDEGENVVFDVDVKGGCNIKQYYGDRALSIFIQPPSVDELRRRLEHRATDSADQIEQRLAKAEEEMTYAPRFDYILINDDLETAKAEAVQLLSNFLKS